VKEFVDCLPKTFGVVGGRRYEAGVVLFFGGQDELVVLVRLQLEIYCVAKNLT